MDDVGEDKVTTDKVTVSSRCITKCNEFKYSTSVNSIIKKDQFIENLT